MRKSLGLLLLKETATPASLLALLSVTLTILKESCEKESSLGVIFLSALLTAYVQQAPTCSNLVATNSPLQLEWDCE